GKSGPEYFMLENRQATGRDVSVPGSGLAVWHIDENQSDNTNPLAYKVGILQADGLRQLELGKNSGDAGDVFPGTTGNTRVDSNSQPSTKAHNGLATKVVLSSIALAGSDVKVRVKV
ncbi:MAG: protease, partial [Betaproteobacteria bacterium]